MEYKICSRCVMDSSDLSIKFDDEGCCNYCSDVIKRTKTEYFPNAEGKARLDKIMAKIKKAGEKADYDCMVGISGGLDSSYVLFLGYKYGLKMLCVHVDDGLDTETAKANIEKICYRSGAKLITIRPDMEQYKDLTRAFFRAGVPNLAFAQDNILAAALYDTAKKYKIRYILSGGNFATESILQRETVPVNTGDKKHILAIHRQFGELPVNNLRFNSLFRNYIIRKYFSRAKTFYPLNYIDYRVDRAVSELNRFCGYEYYGGKHWESVLTRFLQCWYLPEKFNFDKRKSHFSSLIISGQMTREEALSRLSSPAYPGKELMEADSGFLADYLGMTYGDFMGMLDGPRHKHTDYPTSHLNRFAPFARKLRRFLG